jgi:hypothetical protein
MRLRVSVIAAVVSMSALAGTATAGPPGAGTLVLGTSLGGVRLGMTLDRLEQTWGRAYGRCRGCARPTLYFNLFAFRPEGAGVELKRGRVNAVFTLWAPGAWRTAEGVEIGENVAGVTATYGPLKRTQCRGYYALTLPSRRAVNAIYVVGDEVWGLGLLARGAPVCR